MFCLRGGSGQLWQLWQRRCVRPVRIGELSALPQLVLQSQLTWVCVLLLL